MKWLPARNPTATGTLNTSCCNDGTYSPGIYKGGMQLSGHTNVTLNPGTYYLQGNLDVSGGSTLTYDSKKQIYAYSWKTDPSWAGTCRLLTVKLKDGTNHVAFFHF